MPLPFYKKRRRKTPCGIIIPSDRNRKKEYRKRGTRHEEKDLCRLCICGGSRAAVRSGPGGDSAAVPKGCGFPDRLLEAKKKGVLAREEMETAAENILRLILRIE